MKIIVSEEFFTVEDAAEFLQRLGVSRDDVPSVPSAAESPEAPAKKPRKPRSDAGQARGPYKTAAAAQGGAPLSEPTVAPATGGAPAAVVTTAVHDAQSLPTAPTDVDARAALKAVNDTPGLGMQTCMGILAAFDVQRISLLPKEKYPDFIAHCQKIVGQAQFAAKLAAEKAAK